jgi:anti-anti-sigma factor
MSAQQIRSPILHVEVFRRARGATLVCRGEIDISSVDCLEVALAGWVQTEVPELTVDLRETSYVDSTGVEALLRAHLQMLRAGGQMQVLVGSRSARLFRLLGVDRLLNVSSGCAPEAEGCAQARLPRQHKRRRAHLSWVLPGSLLAAA